MMPLISAEIGAAAKVTVSKNATGVGSEEWRVGHDVTGGSPPRKRPRRPGARQDGPAACGLPSRGDGPANCQAAGHRLDWRMQVD